MYEFESEDVYGNSAFVSIRSLDKIAAVVKRDVGMDEDKMDGSRWYDYAVLIGGEFFEISAEEYERLMKTLNTE
jgi:hypothetical protein